MEIGRDDNTRDPVQDRSRRTRQALLEAGSRLIGQKGYGGTNSKEIARAAGTAVGSFYAYFPDKASLFLEIVDSLYHGIFEHLKGVPFDPSEFVDSRRLIRSILERLYDAHDIEPALHREISLMMLAGTNPEHPDSRYVELCGEIRKRVEQLDQEVLGWLIELIRTWNPDTAPSALGTTAALVFRVAEETIHRLKQFPDTLGSPDETLEELTKMLDAYLTLNKE